MSFNHLHSAYLILATFAAVGLIAGLLYYLGVIGSVLGLFGRVVRGSVSAGFRAWEAVLAWADWRSVGVLAAAAFAAGWVAHLVGLDVVAVTTSALLLALGLVTCLAYMYLSFERYEVARGYKAVHNPLKGQELAADLARYGDRVGVMLLVVSAVGTVLGFVQLNHTLYSSFGRDWYRLASPDEEAVFLDFLAYALIHLLRVVDVLDLAQSREYLSVSIVRPAYWPATALLLGFKSFFTLVLLQQVFASVREGKLLAETVNDLWSPHAPIHDRARSALPQFGPSALQPILKSLRSLGPLTREQRDQLPQVFAAIGPTAVPELLRHVRDEHDPTRGVVAKALGLLRAPEAAGPLIGLLADGSETTRAAAVEALGLIAEPAVRGRDRTTADRPARRNRWKTRFTWLRWLDGGRLIRGLGRRGPIPEPEIGPGELVPACVTTLRKALADESAAVRGEAVTALGRIGVPASEAAADLAAVLTTDGDEVRKRAAVSLGLVRAEAVLAVPSLTAALSNPSPEVRAAAATALGEYGPAAADAVQVLVLLLQDREEAVRNAAAEAVSRIGVLGDDSTQLLVDGLQSADNVVRAQTAEALGVIGEMAEETAPSLVAALGDQNDAVRAKAAEALGKIGEGVADIAVPGLVRLLRDEDNWVRALAAEALGQMGEEAADAAPALLRSLSHPNPLVRANAAEALGKLKAEEARSALEAACRDEDAGVRGRAVRALADLGDPTPATTAAVLACLTDADPQVRATAVDAVGGWPGVTVDQAVFLGLVNDGNDEVATRAIRLAPSLATVEAVLPALRGRLHGAPNPLVQTAAATALGRLGPPAADAEAELAAAAREGDADLRLAAMRALALIESPGAAEVFAAGLRDPDPKVRKTASGGLMKMTGIPDDAVPAVVESLRDPDEQVRSNAAHLLSLLDPVPPQAVPDLIAAAEGGGDGLRLNAATALRRVPTPEARDALRRLLKDPNPRVRLVAAGSLAADNPDDPEVRAAVADALRDANPKLRAVACDLVRALGLTETHFCPDPETGPTDAKPVERPASPDHPPGESLSHPGTSRMP